MYLRLRKETSGYIERLSYNEKRQLNDLLRALAQMLAQGIAARGQRIVDPTASPLDQAILDALQGVQTPENVTQTREATALDNIIMAAMNQNKNSATPEQTTESPINGPVRSDAAEAGTSNINAAYEKI